MNRCIGCGAILQTEDKQKIGFIPKEKKDSAKLCLRCFRILHYNDLQIVDLPKTNQVLEIVNKKGKFAFFIVDLLNINTEVFNSYKDLKVPKCLVISKIDFIPKYIKKEKIKEWLREEYKIKEKIIFLSALKNQNVHSITTTLQENHLKEAYLVGFTNAGKSTLVNRLMKENQITTSVVPNTTVDYLKIPLDEGLTLIDSPGLVYRDTLYAKEDVLFIKKINPKSFIKPITYQLKRGASILIENCIRIENHSEKCNLTIYMSNLLEINKIYEKNESLKNLEKIDLEVEENQDLVFKGIGFINFKSRANVTIYIKHKKFMEVRKSFFER